MNNCFFKKSIFLNEMKQVSDNVKDWDRVEGLLETEE